MMTMNEMRALMESLSAIYTDVRLLDAEAVNAVCEGAYTASSGGACYACEHKRHFSRRCAAKLALSSGEKQCRIEVCGADVMHITAIPYSIDGEPYVLEPIQRTPCQGTLDADSGERIMREISGYNTKLYRDAMTGAYNRRYYEEVARKNAVVCAGTPDQPALPNLVEEAKPQILIVDDSEFNRELLNEILRDDYRILEAADGQIGLEQLSRHRSDIGLILLDINMPVMNGFEVKRRKQRTHPAYPHPHRASAPPPA